MPTYDYLCPNGHRFEVIHSLSADSPSSCPICGASPVRKAFTAPTIHFKGSGWAKKDRSTTARSSTPAAAADGSTGSGSGAGSGSGSSDGAETGSSSGSDKGDGAHTGASASSDTTKTSDKGTSSSTTKSKGSASASGPAAGD